MDPDQIKQRLNAELPQCDVVVEGGNGKFQVTITGDVFAGLNAVKRQQLIYKILSTHISSGAIHAISMRLFTKEELDATN